MKTDDLSYDLPPELIAQSPPARRPQSRLLVLNRGDGGLYDRMFADLPGYLRPGDCLVLNNTRVLPARFFAQKPTGAQIEGLFLSEQPDRSWQVLLKNARKLRSGDTLQLLDRSLNVWITAIVSRSRIPGQWVLMPDCDLGAPAILDRIGFAPLPPYIKRRKGDTHTADDLDRYQTVFARRPGAVAAPTAGLHFDQPMLDKIAALGVKIAYITLHVGIGTFRPVETAALEDHPMHEEFYEITPDAASIINTAAASGGRIIAVGTTSVRTLETIAQGRRISPGSGKTAIFIRPGYTFKLVDAILTNFHLPKSTLLALVAAFAGLEPILGAYRHAVEQKYRFFSYGDAMLIL
ncbi:MAG: tRNA preQ1(34) S-adenosylmethionine ribosyltransferase-isomerase QueA [Planctomycetaceae bacterium]|nr:tRNA preQ1(34) S-adenosylmethionine ribosyltransferase-isomerase QueA [Planctomycetaceae bacterium]